jgi:hypothetical protein
LGCEPDDHRGKCSADRERSQGDPTHGQGPQHGDGDRQEADQEADGPGCGRIHPPEYGRRDRPEVPRDQPAQHQNHDHGDYCDRTDANKPALRGLQLLEVVDVVSRDDLAHHDRNQHRDLDRQQEARATHGCVIDLDVEADGLPRLAARLEHTVETEICRLAERTAHGS